MGEPAGIGPEITGECWRQLKGNPEFAFFLVGDISLQRARCSVPVREIKEAGGALAVFPDALPMLAQDLRVPVTAGRPDAANAGSVISSIARCVDLVMAGEASGLVTNPIQKETLYQAGFAFEGHTDYLAELSRQKGHAANAVMMLAAPGLRTVPVTVHVALKRVPNLLTIELIMQQAHVTADGLKRWFGIDRPRLAVAGLNPHAGENGAMGDEESKMIKPAIATLRESGLDVSGPWPADTMFHEDARRAYDVALCMYHDQALIPVKTLGFHEGVNCTLGLPFIRTSPDHGTALSLAGTDKANPLSLISAVRMASGMARQARP